MANRDDTIAVPTAKPVLSQAKLDQLADARVKAMAARREKMRKRLEEKLAHLRSIAGDMNSHQMERVAFAMLEKEEKMRENTNIQIGQINQALKMIYTDLQRIMPPKMRANSEVSSAVSYSTAASRARL